MCDIVTVKSFEAVLPESHNLSYVSTQSAQLRRPSYPWSLASKLTKLHIHFYGSYCVKRASISRFTEYGLFEDGNDEITWRNNMILEHFM